MEFMVLSLKLGGRITVGIKKENEIMNRIFDRMVDKQIFNRELLCYAECDKISRPLINESSQTIFDHVA